MSRSVTTSAITLFSKFAHTQALKAEGFLRSGNYMYRPSDSLIHGIHFQASRWNSANEGQFTINLVITSPIVYETWAGKPFPKNPVSALFPFAQRIGLLLPQRRDLWWEISESTELNEVALEISQLLTSVALPFFAMYPSNSALLDRLRQGLDVPSLTAQQKPLIQAILAQKHGCQTEAATLIHKALADAGASPFKTSVTLIGQRLGIL